MAISLKKLHELELKNYADHQNGKKTSFTWDEVTILLFMARKYKELVKENKKEGKK